MNTTKRLSTAFLCGLAALGTSAWALADTPAKPTCKGHPGKARAAHFKRADKNGDGFLTKDEVGDRRWQRIQVADGNRDGKVSRPELRQARKDGRLGHARPASEAERS